MEGTEVIVMTGDSMSVVSQLQRVLQILSKKGKSGTIKSAAVKGKVCCQATKHVHSVPTPTSYILGILTSETWPYVVHIQQLWQDISLNYWDASVIYRWP